MSRQDGSMKDRVAGLDSVRFVCALLVALSHKFDPPIMAGADENSHRVVWFLNGIVNNLYNGSAAVIVFFVLSGFCIHWPYRDGRPLEVGTFLGRRLVRLGVPLLVAVGLSFLLGLKLFHYNDSILWSLSAELIYYALYPVILPLARRFGFTALVVGAFVLSTGVVLTQPNPYGNYPSYGIQLNWLLALPCWLLGCWLADRMRTSEAARPVPSSRQMWLWRLGIYGLTILLSGLRFHSPLKYQYTLNLFAIVVVWYLAREIVAARQRPHVAWLERAGDWSYSLYLTHVLAMVCYVLLKLPDLGYFFNWVVKMTFCLGGAYAFYRWVERPSHVLARRIGALKPPPRALEASELVAEAPSSAPRG